MSAVQRTAAPQPPQPPSLQVGGAFWLHARGVLERARGARARSRQEWGVLAQAALREARATFPSDRTPLPRFEERFLLPAGSQHRAVFTVALLLFAEQRRASGVGFFGSCLEIAALVCGSHVDDVVAAFARAVGEGDG